VATAIRRLEESDAVANFDCGDEALNNYLKRHAWNNQAKSSIGVTYVGAESSAPSVVIGYFTLATSKALRDSFPKKYTRGLPAYDVPVILLARLAVDRLFGGHGLGRELLSAALRVSWSVSKEVGCRCVIVDAYPTAMAWYRQYGFTALEENKSGAVRMYLDIRTIETARSVS
jgi:GNAT superfamily N-acetyltransferase